MVSIFNTYLKLNKKELLVVAMVAILFIAAAYASRAYEEVIRDMVGLGGVSGAFLYILVTIIGTVIAPVSTLPLLPIATTLWGFVVAALLSILGWTLGAMIAFALARGYGRSFVEKLIDVKKVQVVSEAVLGKHPFWTVLLLRIVMPVDLLSYAVGLFVDMSFFSYTLATLIGVTPFAFVFAYAASLPIIYQIGVGVVAAALTVLVYLRIRKTI
jgi:uncharacterized membrane protein YdjX (TVP38/TMEM64 family)